MKGLLIIFALLTFNIAFSQNDTIELTLNKMSVLAFDLKPKSQIGAPKFFVIKEFDNKLMIRTRYKTVKAFKETNLFVQSGEEMRMFVIVYKQTPKTFIYDFQRNSKAIVNSTNNISSNSKENIVIDVKKLETKLETQRVNKSADSLFTSNCSITADKKQDLFNKGVIAKKMKVVATNFYVDNDYFYLKLVLNNSSKIDYDIQEISFYIKNRDKLEEVTENVSQFDDVKILYKDSDITKVKGKSKQSIVFVFDKFTIGTHKKFTAKIREKNGDRIFDVNFFSNDIANIKQLEK